MGHRMQNWPSYRVVQKDWNWGDPDCIDPIFLRTLDEYLDALQLRIYMTNAQRPAGASKYKNSAHLKDAKGLVYGCDLIPLRRGTKRELFDCFLLATKFPFTGIGIYPQWKYKHGESYEYGGLHLDCSPNRKLRPGQRVGYWMGVSKWFDDKQKYGWNSIAIDSGSLHQYGLL